jgi:hypothetical protein
VEEITHGTHRNLSQRTWRERGTGQRRRVGLLFQLVKENLPGEDFAKITPLVPGLKEVLEAGNLSVVGAWQEELTPAGERIRIEKARKCGRRISEARLGPWHGQ